ncbi:hypothetical protein [Corynebacterium sp. H130]|uniref:hypothetical protein n=1 Tax=Corynebacterium sp. H130 TaxID=3133444 RepID=UPI0030A36B01
MKIRSLEPFEATTRGFTIVVTEGVDLVFDEPVDDVVVCDDLSALVDDHSLTLVLVDPAVGTLIEACQQWHGQIEVWGSLASRGPILHLLSADVPLSVSGCVTSEHWVRLLVSKESPTDRNSADFRLGLAIADAKDCAGSTDTDVPELTQPSVRAALIAAVVPYAKPFKRYLPTRVVVGLYKLLDRIR